MQNKHTYLQNKVNLERNVELSLSYNKTIDILSSQTVKCFKYTAKMTLFFMLYGDYISYEMLYNKYYNQNKKMRPIIVRSTTGELQPILRKTSPNVPEALPLALLKSLC